MQRPLARLTLILCAAVFWGSYTVLSIPLLRAYSPLAVATYSILLGGVMVIPIALVDLDVDYADLTGLIWFAALYSALLSSGFGFFGCDVVLGRFGRRVVDHRWDPVATKPKRAS